MVVEELLVVAGLHQEVEVDLVIVVDEGSIGAEGAAVALEVEEEVGEVREPTRVFRVEGEGFEGEALEDIMVHVEFIRRSRKQYPCLFVWHCEGYHYPLKYLALFVVSSILTACYKVKLLYLYAHA